MSLRVPIILLIVALVLLAYVMLFERGRPGRTEIDARSGLLVEPLVRDRITRIRIASGDKRVALRREGEGFDETWTVERPADAPADVEAVEDYLRSWEFAIPVRTLQRPSAQDLEAFGMKPPKAQVTFEMGGAKVVVSLGSGTPVEGGGYVRVDDGEAVSVVGRDVVELFELDAESFILRGDGGAPLLSDLTESDAGSAQEDAASQ